MSPLLQASLGKISENLMQRLKLKPQKIKQLAEGIRSIASQDEPIRRVSTLHKSLHLASGLECATSRAEQMPVGVHASGGRMKSFHAALYPDCMLRHLPCKSAASAKAVKQKGWLLSKCRIGDAMLPLRAACSIRQHLHEGYSCGGVHHIAALVGRRTSTAPLSLHSQASAWVDWMLV